MFMHLCNQELNVWVREKSLFCCDQHCLRNKNKIELKLKPDLFASCVILHCKFVKYKKGVSCLSGTLITSQPDDNQHCQRNIKWRVLKWRFLKNICELCQAKRLLSQHSFYVLKTYRLLSQRKNICSTLREKKSIFWAAICDILLKFPSKRRPRSKS